MNSEVYELLAHIARYWFLLLMVLIVWYSLKWYFKDRRAEKRSKRFLPDAGYVGRLEVIQTGSAKQSQRSFPVPMEGTIGSGRGCDIRLQGEGIEKIHYYFHFENTVGLMLEKRQGLKIRLREGNRPEDRPICLVHESLLGLGEVKLQLILYQGFECYGLPPEPDEAAFGEAGSESRFAAAGINGMPDRPGENRFFQRGQDADGRISDAPYPEGGLASGAASGEPFGKERFSGTSFADGRFPQGGYSAGYSAENAFANERASGGQPSEGQPFEKTFFGANHPEDCFAGRQSSSREFAGHQNSERDVSQRPIFGSGLPENHLSEGQGSVRQSSENRFAPNGKNEPEILFDEDPTEPVKAYAPLRGTRGEDL